MSKIWFTADTHFGSDRTLEMSKRPYLNPREMDLDMVSKWNSVVKEEDTVYHLGDFGNYDVRKLLNGEIVLLLGNYERNDIEKGSILLEDLEGVYGFDVVLNELSRLQEFDDFLVELVHEPLNGNPHRFKLFGHIHKLQMVRKDGLNVGVDCHNFTPIDMDTVMFYHKAIHNFYDEEVFGY